MPTESIHLGLQNDRKLTPIQEASLTQTPTSASSGLLHSKSTFIYKDLKSSPDLSSGGQNDDTALHSLINGYINRPCSVNMLNQSIPRFCPCCMDRNREVLQRWKPVSENSHSYLKVVPDTCIRKSLRTFAPADKSYCQLHVCHWNHVSSDKLEKEKIWNTKESVLIASTNYERAMNQLSGVLKNFEHEQI